MYVKLGRSILQVREVTLWGIRAGRQGQANSLFLEHNYIAMGWNEVEDLSILEPTSVMSSI